MNYKKLILHISFNLFKKYINKYVLFYLKSILYPFILYLLYVQWFNEEKSHFYKC